MYVAAEALNHAQSEVVHSSLPKTGVENALSYRSTPTVSLGFH